MSIEMKYPPGQRLLLATPLHRENPAWYTVQTEPNQWGIIILETEGGAMSGLTVEQITTYLVEETKNA